MIGFVVFGLFVGVVARVIVPGRHRIGLVATLMLGMLGSVVGGVVANSLGTGSLFELNIIGGTVAIAAAVVFVVIGERVGAIGPKR